MSIDLGLGRIDGRAVGGPTSRPAGATARSAGQQAHVRGTGLRQRGDLPERPRRGRDRPGPSSAAPLRRGSDSPAVGERARRRGCRAERHRHPAPPGAGVTFYAPSRDGGALGDSAGGACRLHPDPGGDRLAGRKPSNSVPRQGLASGAKAGASRCRPRRPQASSASGEESRAAAATTQAGSPSPPCWRSTPPRPAGPGLCPLGNGNQRHAGAEPGGGIARARTGTKPTSFQLATHATTTGPTESARAAVRIRAMSGPAEQ